MRAPRSQLGLLGTLVLAALPAVAEVQPEGPEFQVNTYTTGKQRTQRTGGHLISVDANGNFVVVWENYLKVGSVEREIFGQRYDRSGLALGGEFRVNSFTTGDQLLPSVASSADGSFVVTWESGFEDGSKYGVFGQRYDSQGVPLGTEFRVNSYTTSDQGHPSVAASASGNFVVAWDSFGGQDGSGLGIFGQRYDNSGEPLGGEFRVNSYTPSDQRWPSVASDASGTFVVVWNSAGQDGSKYGIFGQRYDSAGVTLGDEFRVNSTTSNDQRIPSIASDANGNFVVVWSGVYDFGYGSNYGVFGQRYDNVGVAQGDEFRVNTYTTNAQSSPSVSFDASGNFIVVWQSWQDGGSGGQFGRLGVFGQRYDNAGVADGGEFQINSYTTGPQRYPDVATTDTNQFVVIWESSHDGSLEGVFGQRYGDPPSISISDVSLNEGNTATKPRLTSAGSLATFTATLSAASTQTITVNFSTADGTATAPSDYSSRSGTLTFLPGQISGSIGINVNGDNLPESDETFFLNLSNPTNATIADGQAVGTILNDDP